MIIDVDYAMIDEVSEETSLEAGRLNLRLVGGYYFDSEVGLTVVYIQGERAAITMPFKKFSRLYDASWSSTLTN